MGVFFFFSLSLAVAEPGVFIASTVEEVDRLQPRHPSRFLYESAVMNLIGGGLAFSPPHHHTPPTTTTSENVLKTGDTRRQAALTAPPDVGKVQALTSPTEPWVQTADGIVRNACGVPRRLFLELLHRIADARQRGKRV